MEINIKINVFTERRLGIGLCGRELYEYIEIVLFPISYTEPFQYLEQYIK